MGCLVGLVVLAMPRVVMVLMWLFSDYLSRAYEGWLIPLVGFFLLPTTTLAYSIAENETGGLRSWGLILVIVAVLVDVGIWGRGRGIFSRD